MCEDCGCQEGNARAYFDAHGHSHDHGHHHHSHSHGAGEHQHVHTHVSVPDGREIHIHIHIDGGSKGDHSHGHDHTHDHAHDHGEGASEEATTRTIDLESKVLARNDELAEKNRQWLAKRKIAAVNLISSPGTGKTYLLERTLEALKGKVKCAVIAGDQQTDNDAQRLKAKGAPVIQIETKSSCHLNAEQVGECLETVAADAVELLFIENVGNLVCPAAFDLGEASKIALLSVTEGEDKPLKYPVIFHDAPVSVVTKMDLVPHLDVDIEKCRNSIRAVRPDARIFELSAKNGDGMESWLEYLTSLAKG